MEAIVYMYITLGMLEKGMKLELISVLFTNEKMYIYKENLKSIIVACTYNNFCFFSSIC